MKERERSVARRFDLPVPSGRGYDTRLIEHERPLVRVLDDRSWYPPGVRFEKNGDVFRDGNVKFDAVLAKDELVLIFKKVDFLHYVWYLCLSSKGLGWVGKRKYDGRDPFQCLEC